MSMPVEIITITTEICQTTIFPTAHTTDLVQRHSDSRCLKVGIYRDTEYEHIVAEEIPFLGMPISRYCMPEFNTI